MLIHPDVIWKKYHVHRITSISPWYTPIHGIITDTPLEHRRRWVLKIAIVNRRFCLFYLLYPYHGPFQYQIRLKSELSLYYLTTFKFLRLLYTSTAILEETVNFSGFHIVPDLRIWHVTRYWYDYQNPHILLAEARWFWNSINAWWLKFVWRHTEFHITA